MVKKKEWRKAKSAETVFVLAAEIIHVLDSIVRCASSNVFIVFFWQCFLVLFLEGGTVLF